MVSNKQYYAPVPGEGIHQNPYLEKEFRLVDEERINIEGVVCIVPTNRGQTRRCQESFAFRIATDAR